MNLSLFKYKFILTITLAVIFQFNNIILTQWLIEIDDNLKNTKYKIYSNEMKLKDLDNNIFDIIPDLVRMGDIFEVKSNLYYDYYNNKNEYEKKFSPILQHLKFYLIYIRQGFFLESNNGHIDKLHDIEKDFNELKNRRMSVQLNFLIQRLLDVKTVLLETRTLIHNKNNELISQKFNYEGKRFLMNIGLVITQILHLLCLSFFFFFFFSDNSQSKKIDIKNYKQ